MSVDPSPPRFVVKVATALVSGLLVLMSVQLAGAQMVSVLNFSSEPTPKPDWIVTLGLNTSYGPTYSGASGTGFSFGPSDFSIRRPDEPAGFSAPDDGFDITLFDYDGLSVGPVANYRSGRSGSDDGKLVGLYDISPTVDIGAFAEYWVLDNRLRLRIEMRQALRAPRRFAGNPLRRLGRAVRLLHCIGRSAPCSWQCELHAVLLRRNRQRSCSFTLRVRVFAHCRDRSCRRDSRTKLCLFALLDGHRLRYLSTPGRRCRR